MLGRLVGTPYMAVAYTLCSWSTETLGWCPATAWSAAPCETFSASLRPGPAQIQLWGQMCQFYNAGRRVVRFRCDEWWPWAISNLSCGFLFILSYSNLFCFHPCHAQIFILSGRSAYISWLQPPLDTETTVFHSCHYQLPQVSQFYKSIISYHSCPLCLLES